MTRLRRRPLPGPRVSDPSAEAYAAVAPHTAAVRPGDSVAIGVGSRGIRDIAAVVAGIVLALRARGAEPYIVPAMGSHGGSTAEGQAETLRTLGVDQTRVGAPIRATMTTVPLGLHVGVDVAIDAYAADADHLVVVNRLKSHTSFSGHIESGLAKMLAIGLGKQHGAEELHRLGPRHIEERICRTAAYVCNRLPVLGGLALIEGADKSLARIAWVPPDGIGGAEEAALLTEAKTHEPRLPFDEIDVLIVDAMGKEFSGTGMDTNVIGRRMVRSMPELVTPRITSIVCLRVSSASHGNAVGIGLADFIPMAALAGVDLLATYTNTLTAGSQAIQRAQIPVVMADDADAVRAALLTSDIDDWSNLRLARIRNTLQLENMLVSAALAQLPHAGYEHDGESPLFRADGSLNGW